MSEQLVALDQFSLMQNYPNPFNASTRIRYDLPVAAHATLSVYDVQGREVTTLVNDAKQPGVYTVQWGAGEAASGVYLCLLRAGDFVQHRKLLLLK